MSVKKIQIHSTIDLSDLIEELVTLDDETIKQFIVDLDLAMADYTFTLALRDHFVKEIKKENAVK